MARSDNRTERPTPKRLREARREGRIAKSKEIGAAVTLLSALVAFRFLAPGVGRTLSRQTQEILAAAADGTGGWLASGAAAMFLVGLTPFLAVAVVGGVAGGLLQSGFHLSPKAAAPKLSNLSLKKGLQRFKPSVMGWELARSALKLGLLVAVIWGPAVAWVDTLARPRSLADGVASTAGMVSTVILRAAVLALAIAIADYAVSRYRVGKELKMTRQELKDELKQTEGDPLTRQARRRRAHELSRNRMIRDVASADVVVTNPVRLAVALRYGAGYPAPQIVAKGAGGFAARIRAEAYRNGVPVIEDKPLARALFRKSSIGQYVPAALYEAAAVVLATAYRRRPSRAAA